jgi:cephalosporin-C deacetylase-like acetyl esterase
MIKQYTLRGYIVFTPLLRGVHDDQYAFTNTGLYIDDYLDTLTNPTASNSIDYLHQEIAEVRAALTYLTTFSIGGIKQVDPARIALTGHSFGGSTGDLRGRRQPQPAAGRDRRPVGRRFELGRQHRV